MRPRGGVAEANLGPETPADQAGQSVGAGAP